MQKLTLPWSKILQFNFILKEKLKILSSMDSLKIFFLRFSGK
jgi:hypothetical protein